jgi:Cytochrome c552/Cytochrome c554 and c-prime
MRRFRGIRKAENQAVLSAALGLSAVVAGAMWALRSPLVSERDVGGRPIQVPGDGYTSSQTCRACHPSQYVTWHASYHRTMTQLAAPETVATSFDGVRVDGVPGAPMVLEQRGRELWAEFDDPDSESAQSLVRASSESTESGVGSRRIKRHVVMTTGSHNQQIYWYATGQSRVLGQLPAIYLVGERRWIPRRAAVMHPPGQAAFSETGSWNAICVSCHATSGKPAFDSPFGSRPIASQTADTIAAEFGVACEACHGPSDVHADANRSPPRRYALHLTGRPDETVVQPSRLNPRLSAQVCGQCHAFWEFYDPADERRANTRGLPYRPGDDLAATRFIVQPSRNGGSPTMKAFLADDPGFIRDIFWSDGMVRATGREYNGLIESPCYRNAKDDAHTLTCSSCHTMHQGAADTRSTRDWADDQLAPVPRNHENDRCTRCHGPTDSGLAGHTNHRADSAGSSCMNCHMPYTTYGLLKTIRSHQISNPSVRASLDTGRPNACNLCHLDKTLAWTAAYLERWYRTPQPTLDDDERAVAASLVWLLKGDAGQRAIVAQSMGWAPAQQASGTGWLTPYLALLQKDPYDAVRLIATRSLTTLPGFHRDRLPRGAPQLLIDADGTFNAEVVNRLVRSRDNRRVVYRE